MAKGYHTEWGMGNWNGNWGWDGELASLTEGYHTEWGMGNRNGNGGVGWRAGQFDCRWDLIVPVDTIEYSIFGTPFNLFSVQFVQRVFRAWRQAFMRC